MTESATDHGAARAMEVQWLSSEEPPRDITMHLRTRGLTLCTREASTGPMPPARLLLVETVRLPATKPPRLDGVRVAVLDPDPGNADALSQALREKGAQVVALSVNPESLARAEALDPDVVVMEPRDFCGSCWEIVRALWQHPRLRFATVLLAAPEPIGAGGATALDVHGVSEAIRQATSAHALVRETLREKQELVLSLDTLGPVRTLRALVDARRSLRARFACPDLTIEVDLSDELVVGAQGGPGSTLGDAYLGAHALSLLLYQDQGQVSVRAVDRPAVTNIMAPLSTALHDALASGTPPVRASGVRFGAVPAERKSITPRAVAKVDRVVTKSLAPAPTTPQPNEIAEPSVLERNEKHVVAVASPPGKVPRDRPVLPARESMPKVSMRTLAGIAPAPVPALLATPKAPAVVPSTRAQRSEAQAPAPPLVRTEPAPPPSAVAPAATPLPEIARRADLEATPHIPYDLSMSAHADGDALQAADTASQATGRTGTRRRLATMLGAPLLLCAVLTPWLWPESESPRVRATAHAAASARPAHPATAAPPSATPTHVAQQAPEASPSAEPEETGESRRARARRASKLVSQGHSFRRQSKFASAAARYEQALEEYPGYPRAFAGLTQLALAMGKPDEAVRHGKRLVDARPRDARYRTLLGDAYQAAGRASDARDAYKAAARLGDRTALKRLTP